MVIDPANDRRPADVPSSMAHDRQIPTARETRQRIKREAGWLAAAGSVVLLPLTVLPFVGWRYPLELLSHFQMQYFLAALACAALLALLRRWRWFGVSLGSLFLAGAAILPYQGVGAAAHADVTGNGPSVRVLFANVQVSNRAHDRVLELVRTADADVLVFQEVNDRWKSALTPITAEYPHVAGMTREDPFGTMVYSRLPILDHATLSHDGAARWSLRLTIDVQGTPLSVVCTHPMPPVRKGSFELRNEQLQRVTDLAGTLPRPLVVVGDLNTTMWSPWFRKLCDQADLASARRGVGVLGSWPASMPGFLRIPIDHVLVSPDVTVAGCRLGDAVGSDHLPIIVDLQLP